MYEEIIKEINDHKFVELGDLGTAALLGAVLSIDCRMCGSTVFAVAGALRHFKNVDVKGRREDMKQAVVSSAVRAVTVIYREVKRRTWTKEEKKTVCDSLAVILDLEYDDFWDQIELFFLLVAMGFTREDDPEAWGEHDRDYLMHAVLMASECTLLETDKFWGMRVLCESARAVIK